MKFGISFTLTHLNQAGALVHVYQDGSIHMNHGGTEMGQGLFQKVAQVAAAGLACRLSGGQDHRDRYRQGAQHLGHGGLVGSDLNGMAVKAACDTIRDRIAEHLAERYQRAARQGRISPSGKVIVGDAEMTFAEAAQALPIRAGSACRPPGFTRRPKARMGPHRRAAAGRFSISPMARR